MRDWKDDDEWKNRLLDDVDPDRPGGGPILWLGMMCGIGILVGLCIAVVAILA